MATRNITRVSLPRVLYKLPLLADAVIKQGEIVLRTTASGFVRQGAVVTGCVGIGIAMADVDNTGGAAGAKTVDVEQGVYLLDNIAGGNAVTNVNVGGSVYAADQNTVTAQSANRSPVGPCVGLGWSGEAGVLVRIES